MIDIDYMIENDTKGYFGAFSKAGKNSAELMVNIRQKDRLLNPKKYRGNKKSIVKFLKRNGYHNIHGDDEILNIIKQEELDDSQIEEVEEEVDIFKKEEKKDEAEIKEKPKLSKKEVIKFFHRTNPEYYKFHDATRLKDLIKPPFQTPKCTKYVPNKEIVWKRTLVGPDWYKLRARKPLFEGKNSRYYLNHEDPLKNVGPNFIDMDKQTMRGNNIISHDLRIITARPFTSRNDNYNHTKNSKNKNESINESQISEYNKANPNILMKYEKNSYSLKEKRKRTQSSKTNSTRPQTSHPNYLNTINSNNSRLVSSSYSMARNITTNSKYLNTNNYTGLNNSLSEENDKEVYSASSSELNDSYTKFKNIYQHQIKPKVSQSQNNRNINKRYSDKSSIGSSKNKKNSTMTFIKNLKRNVKNMKDNILKSRPKSSSINKKINSIKKVPKNKIKGPDFEKTISREYYDNLSDHKAALIPFSLPNFKQVRERPLTMVVYERPTYTKKKERKLTRITPDMYNDIYRYIEKINNHKRCLQLNFEKMKSRPNEEDSPLPSYMKKLASRGACEKMTDISLKMNNYAEGKFLSSYTSFWPKKSYNKIINLNLLNSDTFLSHLINDKKENKPPSNYVVKSMKFYHKNYEELLKEGLLTKFDNVTYKSIKPRIKAELKIMDKFIEKYGNEGQNKKLSQKNV